MTSKLYPTFFNTFDNLFELITKIRFSNNEKAKLTMFTFEKCAEPKHYFVKLDSFVPFCRPSYVKVVIHVMPKFVNTNSLKLTAIPKSFRKQRQCVLGIKITCHNAHVLKMYSQRSILNLFCVGILINNSLWSL